MKPLIELNHINFGYGAELALEDICLHLHKGQFAALVGPSGAGKTTLLKVILGLVRPTYGQFKVNGLFYERQDRLRVGYVPQLETVDWNFPITVEQLVLLGKVKSSGPWPWSSQADRRQMAELLERLGIADLAHRHIRDLSGGQQQRVFLARALIAEPDLLVLDEPTSGVDIQSAENILRLLAELNRRGMSILITTHDLNAAAAHLPWVICINRRIIAEGSPEDIFTETVLNETYRGDMMVIRMDGMLFVQQKPHGHTYHDLLPNPVMGERYENGER
jgi:ABC-type Mn2+/Zn2+ transport system ATPase subunit